jgi:hypothetical protein
MLTVRFLERALNVYSRLVVRWWFVGYVLHN